jgi:hypothetical protein
MLSDEDIRELIADETPMRRAYELGLQDGRMAEVLREEFWVCGAAGYPDPFHCDTLERARRFALDHEFNHVQQRKVEVTILRRLVSDQEVVWANGHATDSMGKKNQ